MMRAVVAAALLSGACTTAAADHERLGDRAYREGRFPDAVHPVKDNQFARKPDCGTEREMVSKMRTCRATNIRSVLRGLLLRQGAVSFPEGLKDQSNQFPPSNASTNSGAN